MTRKSIKVMSKDLVRCNRRKGRENRKKRSRPDNIVMETILHWTSFTVPQGPRFQTSLWHPSNLFKKIWCPVRWRKKHTSCWTLMLPAVWKGEGIVPWIVVFPTHYQCLPIFLTIAICHFSWNNHPKEMRLPRTIIQSFNRNGSTTF